MRIVDIQMSCSFILIAIIWASVFGTGRWSVVLIVALRGWVTFARIIRSRVLAVREMAFVESTLGFLGLGVQASSPTLGNMLADGREYRQTAWCLVVFPGWLLICIVMAVNSFGDGLRDALDPRSARSAH